MLSEARTVSYTATVYRADVRDFGAVADGQTDSTQAFQAALDRFKAEGFERINPSILKSTIQADYPNFDERTIGFKRFSDVMKELEKQGLLRVEMDEAHTMLLKIC